jgi:hypothetical protein
MSLNPCFRILCSLYLGIFSDVTPLSICQNPLTMASRTLKTMADTITVGDEFSVSLLHSNRSKIYLQSGTVTTSANLNEFISGPLPGDVVARVFTTVFLQFKNTAG